MHFVNDQCAASRYNANEGMEDSPISNVNDTVVGGPTEMFWNEATRYKRTGADATLKQRVSNTKWNTGVNITSHLVELRACASTHVAGTQKGNEMQ